MTPAESALPADFTDILGLAAIVVFLITSVSAVITSAVISRNGFLHLGIQVTLLLLALHATYHWSWNLWFTGVFADREVFANTTLAAAMLAAAVAFDLALKYILWEGSLARDGHLMVPKLLIGVVRVLIYLLAILIVLQFVYGQSITALATLSGAFALVIGLSAQSTLGEMFAGIAIALSNPFRVGDWVKIGNLEEGKVIDMTWRLVRIECADMVVLTVTNRVVADSPIRNFTFPNRIVRVSELIYFDQKDDPIVIQQLLARAMQAAKGVVPKPAVHALYRGAHDGVAQYEMRYFVDDWEWKGLITERVWKNVLDEVRKAGRGIAIPVRRVELAAEPVGAAELAAAAEN
jgi:small-conductance mechanosensitive channel